ncbi:MAG: ankyrin repeat domain-containing protein [Myxococcales bacterium]|nr:ankyrin repeat domain-containing protein [Myxococcales bacterium]
MSPEDFVARVHDDDIAAVTAALAADPSLVAVRDCYHGSTPLHFAAHRGHTRCVEALLAAGADIHARERVSGTTALHWSAEAGVVDVTRILLSAGADLEARDEWFDLTPLGWSSVVRWAPERHRDRPATAALLLAGGARHDIFTATACDLPELVRSLVAADATQLTRRLGFVGDEQTPLHLAVSLRRPAIVRLLIELGADLAALTADGASALALAADEPDLAGLLRSLGASDDASSYLVSRDLSALGALLDRAPVSQQLFFAARHNHADALALLLRRADPHARARRLVGETPESIAPLHLAAQYGHTAALAALLDAGADIRGGAEPGVPTPLHVAARNGHREATRLLVDRGADLHDRDRHHHATPRGWAEWGGHREIADILRTYA